MNTNDTEQAVRQAVDHLGGTAAKAAREITRRTGRPCSRHVVAKWLDRGVVSPEWVGVLAALTPVTAERLRPTVFYPGCFEANKAALEKMVISRRK